MDYSVFVVLFIFYVISVVIITGLLNARAQNKIVDSYHPSGSIKRREELGECLLLSTLISLVSVVGAFSVYLETGFGASGWSLKPERGE